MTKEDEARPIWCDCGERCHESLVHTSEQLGELREKYDAACAERDACRAGEQAADREIARLRAQVDAMTAERGELAKKVEELEEQHAYDCDQWNLVVHEKAQLAQKAEALTAAGNALRAVHAKACPCPRCDAWQAALRASAAPVSSTGGSALTCDDVGCPCAEQGRPQIGDIVEVNHARKGWRSQRVTQRIIEGNPTAFAPDGGGVLYDKDEGHTWRWPSPPATTDGGRG